MTRLITWSLIIVICGLALTWMLRPAQAQPRRLPEAAAEPTIGQRAGAATSAAVDHTIAAGERLAAEARIARAGVAQQTAVAVDEVTAAGRKIAAQAQTVVGAAATTVGEAAATVGEAARHAADQTSHLVDGLAAPARDAATP